MARLTESAKVALIFVGFLAVPFVGGILLHIITK